MRTRKVFLVAGGMAVGYAVLYPGLALLLRPRLSASEIAVTAVGSGAIGFAYFFGARSGRFGGGLRTILTSTGPRRWR